METKTWEELAEARLTEAKARLVKSEARLAYLSSESMSFIHEEVRAKLVIVESSLEEMIASASDTNRSTFVEAELELAEAEIRLAKVEVGLLMEMIEFDMFVSRESKMASRFLAEEVVRLAEAEVRFSEAEMRLVEDNIWMMHVQGIDLFLDPRADDVGKFLHDTDMALPTTEDKQELSDAFSQLGDGFRHQYSEMSMLAHFFGAEAKMKMRIGFAEAELRLAKTELQLEEAKLRYAEAKLQLAKTFNVDDYL